MKFGEKVVLGPRKNPLDVGGNPDHVTLRLGLGLCLTFHVTLSRTALRLCCGRVLPRNTGGIFHPTFVYFFIKGLLLGLGGGM